MKAEFLKIAGVKSEAEFYKKFPTEEAFMKKHGKDVKKLMVKNAQIGAMIPNIETPTENLKPVRIDEEFLYDAAASRTGRKSMQEEKEDAMYQAQMEALNPEKKKPSLLERLTGLVEGVAGVFDEQVAMSDTNDLISGGGIGGGQNGGGTVTDFEVGPLEQLGGEFKIGGKIKKAQDGYSHPYLQNYVDLFRNRGNIANQQDVAGIMSSMNVTPSDTLFVRSSGDYNMANTMADFELAKYLAKQINPEAYNAGQSVPVTYKDRLKFNVEEKDVYNDKGGYTSIKKSKKKAQGGVTATPQFDLNVGDSGPSRQAYYNPDGSVNKAATFSGQMNDILRSKAVQIGAPIISDIVGISDQMKAQKEQLAQAKQSRMVAEIALDAAKSEPEKIERDYVRPEDIQNTGEEFFPIYGVGTNVLARNGGMFSDPGYMPLENVNQVKSFARGGVLGSNSYLVPRAQGGFDMSNISYGGGSSGGVGQQIGQFAGFNQDAGSNIGGKIGGTIGSVFGPVGSMVGSFLGSGVGDLLDRDDRRTRIENERAERATKNLAFAAAAPQIQAGYASHVKDGGTIESMRSGGHMRGSYIPPNPSALDTMAMGGEVKTTWGGKVETVSYNPYAGGESIEFKGNSHDYLDPRTGQTGIGVAYGKNSVANNEAVVEVENEPAQQLRDGGGTENLVVYGDLKIPEEYIPEINDERAKGMKFKDYVSKILNKDEAKVNKKMENAADKGLESDNTVWGQVERSTANVIIDGGDMTLQDIALKKTILADLQNALNETFDEYGIKGNEFIAKNKIVEDAERMEMAKYGKKVPKLQESKAGNVSKDDFNRQPPEEFKTEEEAIAAGYVKQDDGRLVKYEDGETKVAITGDVNLIKERQSLDPDTDLYGGITMSDVDKMKKQNTWYDWKNNFDLTKPKVKGPDGTLVHPDVLKFQEEACKKLKAAGQDCARVDGKLGKETVSINVQETKETPKTEKIAKVAESTTETTTTAVPKQAQVPFIGGVAPVRGEALSINQILPELYAAATNQVQPVYAQTYQPALRVPYDISLQTAKNDVIAQSRALQRNPALQNNPAALALAQAPTYEALNKINEAEFIANQKMKDEVYSGNIEALNKARLMNLGIYDQQYDRQTEAVAKTRTQNIDILKSISDKYAQKKLENRLEQVFSNLYPTYRYDRNFRTQVQQPGMISIPGYGTVYGIPSLATPGFNPLGYAQQAVGLFDYFQNAQQQWREQNPLEPTIKENALDRELKRINAEDIVDYGPSGTLAKKGKTVKKNHKNSNILRELRNR